MNRLTRRVDALAEKMGGDDSPRQVFLTSVPPGLADEQADAHIEAERVRLGAAERDMLIVLTSPRVDENGRARE